jgi:hypothetical protein
MKHINKTMIILFLIISSNIILVHTNIKKSTRFSKRNQKKLEENTDLYDSPKRNNLNPKSDSSLTPEEDQSLDSNDSNSRTFNTHQSKKDNVKNRTFKKVL